MYKINFYFLNKKLQNKENLSNFIIANYPIFLIRLLPGNYCERVIPDPIPNSEVKPFCADGTLS